MRPLRLTMTGFGPYKYKTCIDMQLLGTGGLYLVTGDTGAGKTFIFDAITYALYGETSGGSRDSRTLRSQYAGDDDKTEVELVFMYAGNEYTVTRNPEYMRHKKRGEGFTQESASAVLKKPDGSVVDGPSKVTEEIKNILGIDRGQFCNIVMIAQGEFRRLLNAGTEERQKLFRKLFDTMPYNELADELRDAGKAVDDEYAAKRAEIDMALASVCCSFDDEISSRLEELRTSDNTKTDDITDTLGSFIEYSESKSEETSEALKENEEILTEANSRLAVIESYRENVRKLDEAKASVSKLEDDIRTAEFELQLANEDRELIENLQNEAAVMESRMDSYDALDEINAEIAEAGKNAENIQGELKSFKDRRNAAKDELDGIRSQLDDLRFSDERMAKIRNEIERNNNRISRLDSMTEEIGKVNELRKRLEKEQEALMPLLAEAEKLEREHSEAYSSFLSGQAGLLAAGLREGEPCPVCGSRSHPSPAESSFEVFSADDIDSKQAAAKKARELAADKAGEAQKTKGSLNATEYSARETALRETGSDDLDAALSKASADTDRLRSDIIALELLEEDLRSKAEHKTELEELFMKAEKEHEEFSEKAAEADRELVKINSDLNALSRRRSEMAAELSYDSRKEAEEHVGEIRRKAQEKLDAIEEAAANIAKAKEAKASNDARIEELEKVIEGFAPMDEIEAIETKAAAEEKKEKLTELGSVIAADLINARSALESISSNAVRLEEIRKEHEIIDPLVRTATGSLQGKDRMSLETYVQAFYFERIIRRANLRLRLMSGGQYEFVRSGVAADKRSRFGLDLNVIDHYSGTERPVSTLSGGESFMASLALALGLSDEVQASAGGIRLDTMFVDEGFGSLDSETLEKAIRTLTELSDEDRLVGIISHVDALKTRIEKQIIVTKDRADGSSVKVISQ